MPRRLPYQSGLFKKKQAAPPGKANVSHPARQGQDGD